MCAYSPPVARLLELGYDYDSGDGVTYAAEFGLTADHIPELFQLATEKERWVDWQEPESVGPQHAITALAEMKPIELLPRLLDFIAEMERLDAAQDWLFEEFPHDLALFGRAAFPFCQRELGRVDRPMCFRSAMSQSLQELAARFPDLRDEAIRAIIGVIDRTDEVDERLNAFITHDLVQLKAVEVAGQLEDAYQHGRINPSMYADWPYIRFQLGLGPEPAPFRTLESLGYRATGFGSLMVNGFPPRSKNDADKRKAKRKEKKQARKRNRQR